MKQLKKLSLAVGIALYFLGAFSRAEAAESSDPESTNSATDHIYKGDSTYKVTYDPNNPLTDKEAIKKALTTTRKEENAGASRFFLGFSIGFLPCVLIAALIEGSYNP